MTRWSLFLIGLLAFSGTLSGCLRAFSKSRDFDKPRVVPKRPTNPHYVGPTGPVCPGQFTSEVDSGLESPYGQQQTPINRVSPNSTSQGPRRQTEPKSKRDQKPTLALEVPPTEALQPKKKEPQPSPPTPPPQQTVEKRAPRDVEPVVRAMEALLDDHHDDALKHLKHYDAATEDIFIRLLPPLTLLTKKSIDELSPKEVAMLTNQLESLLDNLRPHTQLAIRKVHFCEWIRSFGVYKPLEEDHVFLASRQTSGKKCPGELVQLYVELGNVGAEQHGSYHVTRLSSTVEIRNHKGERIWFYRFDDRKQPIRARSLLHDYYNNYSFYVPHIPAGTYTLTIRVADETFPKRRRTAEKSLEFRVNSVPRPTSSF